MVDRRDYQEFLRASADTKTSMRSVSRLLPAAPQRAQLWMQFGLLTVSGLLPLALWFFGRLAALDLVLLYFAEGASYGLAVLARVLFTAAAETGDERPRAISAISYLLRYVIVWPALCAGALALIAPRPGGVALLPWLKGSLGAFANPAVWLPASLTAAFLILDVIRRSDYIDAYLERGPRETARYGFVYPFAMIYLLFSAVLIWIPLHSGAADNYGNAPLLAPTFFALWLVGWRVGLKLLTLTLPIWGRALAVFEVWFERVMGSRKP